MLNKILKISMVVIIVGIVLTAIGLIVVGPNFEGLIDRFNIDDQYESVSKTGTLEVANVKIEAINRRIIVVASDQGEVVIDYFESERDYFIYSFEDGIMHLKNKTVWPTIRLIPTWVSSEINTITIHLPSSYSGKLDLMTTNGAIDIQDIPVLESIHSHTTNGSSLVKNTKTTGNMHVSSTNGEIKIEDTEVEGELEAETTNGSIRLSYVVCERVNAQTTNGDITVTMAGDEDDYKIDVRTTNGQIKLNGLGLSSQVINSEKIPYLKLRTTNGKITITFN